MNTIKIISKLFLAGLVFAFFSGAAFLVFSGFKNIRLAPKVFAAGNTYYVSVSGNDANAGTLAAPWKTVGKAAATLSAGDTVYIRSGIYKEQVIATRSGSAGAYITYSAYPGETVTLDGTGVSIPVGPGNAMFQINANYITVNGLKIINSRGDGVFTNGDHVTISNNYIADTTYCTYPTSDACSPIKIIGASNVLIEGNEVSRAASYIGVPVAETWQEAISVALSSNGIIRNNYVHHNSGECYNVKNGASNWTAYNNRASHCTSNAFYVDAWDKYTHDIEYYNNTVVDTDNNAFVIGSEHGGLLENVYYHNNIAYNNPSTSGFIILDNSWNEFLPNFKNIYIYNNIAYNNTFGFYIARKKGTATNVIFKDNIAAFNTNAQIIWTNSGAGDVTLKYNLVYPFKSYANEVKGANPMEADPLFANPATGDFHLKSKSGRWDGSSWLLDSVQSPAIDAGDPLSDYSLEPSPNGLRINLGNYGNTAEASKTYSESTPPPPTPSNSVAFWKFDETSGITASDSSGNNNTGTVSGAIWIAGKTKNSLNFDGADDYVDAGNGTSLNVSGNQLSIEAWIKPANMAAYNSIVTKGTSSANYAYFLAIGTSYNNSVSFQLANTSGGLVNLKGNTNIVLNQWQHVAGVYDGNSISVYINGVNAGTSSFSGNLRVSGINVNIGKYASGGFFNGAIDEVKIYNRALSADEILAEYNSGNIIFSPADLNQDGIVNSVDFGILMSYWNSVSRPKADLNQDGIVNSVDFGIMMSKWGA